MNPTFTDPDSPLNWTQKILSTGEKIDKATTGAIAAAVGAAAVLGWVVGGLFWMPFAAFICVLIYRLARYYEERDERRFRQHITLQEQVRRELESINNSNLEDNQKAQMAELLTEAAVHSARRNRLLKP